MGKKLGLVVIVLLLSPFVFAQKGGSGASGKKFEFRVTLGQLYGSSTDFNNQILGLVPNTPNIKSPYIGSADLLYISDASVLYGLRYEFLNYKGSAHPGGINNGIANIDTELTGSRINALRIPFGYLGITSHFNLGYNKLTYDVTTKTGSGTTKDYEYTGKTNYGYGLALEGAYYADGLYPSGFEIGYTAISASSFTDSTGAAAKDTNSKDLSLDLSGLYAKIYVGFVF